MIKKKLFKYGSVFMCAALMACSLAACSTNSSKVESATAVSVGASNDSESILQNALTDTLNAASDTKANNVSTEKKTNSKDETVYVFTDVTGKQDHVIVNEKLNNVTGASTIQDFSKLSNIKNLTGDETSTTGSDNKLTWAADGNSITYQGTTTQQTPVTIKVTYYLDGKEISADKLAGQSGKVKIRFDYTNNEKKTITVNGKEQIAYVPFTVLTGMVLPKDTFSNIEVTNGKVISNGSSNIIMAIAAPGLSKNYDNNEELEKLNSVTIKYDTTKFKLNSLMSVATPSLLSETDINFDDLNDVYDSVDTLNSSFDQIIAGGQTLQSGLKQYASKYSEFDQGVGSLKTGAASALVGSQKLTTGIETLYNGLVTLDGKSATLVSGAKQVFNTLLTTTQTQINNQLATIGMSIELTIDNYQTVLNGLMAKLPAENQPSIKTALAQLDSYNKFYQGLQSYTDGVAQLKEGAQSAVDGSKQLSEGLSSLSDGSNTLVQASSQLKTASNQLAQGSDALVDGLTLFKSKGLDKISSVLNDTVKKDVDTTQKLVDLANDYKTFADSKDGVEAKTKFIMIIDSKSKK